MNRRTASMLTGMALVGLAIVALPQLGFAQSSPQIGTWKLNLQKSEFIPGPAPRSRTLNITEEGQNIRDTVREINAQGNVSTAEVMHVYDGQPHPAPGFPDFDATVITKVDANPFSLIATRLKAGKLVQVGTFVISQDGKTPTLTDSQSNPLACMINSSKPLGGSRRPRTFDQYCRLWDAHNDRDDGQSSSS